MTLNKVFNVLELLPDTSQVILDGTTYDAKIGKHSVWIPKMRMKLPFQYNGHFVEYRDWERGQHASSILNHLFGVNQFYESLRNIVEEYLIFDLFSRYAFSPAVNGFFYIKNLISDFPYKAKHCDPKGAYGFFFENANSMLPTKFDREGFHKEFIGSGLLTCSESALNDICLEGRNNHVNGYIVDIRRSIQDAIHLTMNPEKEKILNKITEGIIWKDDKGNLVRKIAEYTQFPFKERANPYQSYTIGNYNVHGSRDIPYRFSKFRIDQNLNGRTVLDLGCNVGSVCQQCYIRGARQVVGLDNVKEYIECARDLARYNEQQMNFLQMDFIEDVDKVISFINSYFREPIGMVFALAIVKHIGFDVFFKILDNIKFVELYVESSSVKSLEETAHARELENELKKRWKTTFMGYAEDRSKRCLWKVESGLGKVK